MNRTATEAPTPVIVIGPSPDCTGGMARVVEQSLSLDYAGRYAVRLHPLTFARVHREGLFARVIRHVRHAWRLRRVIRAARGGASRRLKPAARGGIVHVHTCSGFTFWRCAVDLIVARRMRCRTVLHVHGAKFDEFFGSASRFGRWMIRCVLSRADRVVALSSQWREVLILMAPTARIEVIENAVELPVLDRGETEAGQASNCRFLLLARMDVWKGIHDLLEACSLLRDRGAAFHVTLAGPPGSAGDRRSLTERIAELGLTDFVTYVGNLGSDAKWRALADADVYIQPSHHEGMPIALLEALAGGLPIVATRVGAVGEVLDGSGAGIVTGVRDPVALADAMADLIDDPTRRAGMSVAARRLAESRFSLRRFRDRHRAMYDDLTGQCIDAAGHVRCKTAFSVVSSSGASPHELTATTTR